MNPSRPNLCDSCGWKRDVITPKGSYFLLCRLSEFDIRFPKYPRLPIWRCDGFRPADRYVKPPG